MPSLRWPFVSRSIRRLSGLAGLLLMAHAPGLLASEGSSGQNTDPRPDFEAYFLELGSPDEAEREAAFAAIETAWQPGHTVMALEVVRFLRPTNRNRLLRLMRAKTGKDFGIDFNAWYEWIWSREPTDAPRYAEFKALLYGQIDSRFRGYFSSQRASTIRLDEVRWGGVAQDGIPPLRSPPMSSAEEADYLGEGDIVFGLEIAGDVRAYPKRILAWHEMFTDRVGGIPVVGVYCTLCGSMIVYDTRFDGVEHRLGTSGFLYRSNKLMYDQATQSLWNTLWGRPVIGPLVGGGIELEALSVVTTTWGEWRRRHPETRVLSLDTGHERDYGEGVAYRDYFATDELMFTVPELDRRLRNKDEVLVIPQRSKDQAPLALASRFLRKHPIHHERHGDLSFVVLTDRSGAHRAFELSSATPKSEPPGGGEPPGGSDDAGAGLRFVEWDRDRLAIDADGARWTLGEDALVAEDGRRLRRLPAHRAFWFGWYAANPDTRLVK